MIHKITVLLIMFLLNIVSDSTYSQIIDVE